MQYKVPQNIDIEDKIVGPFTMKQFIYLLIAGFIIYGWWNFSSQYVSPPPMLIFIPIALPVGIIGFAFAIVKVNDRPFETFVLNFFKFVGSPKRRVWRDDFKGEEVIVRDPAAPVAPQDANKDTRSLDDLAKSLEKQSGEIRKKQGAGSKAQGVNTRTSSAPLSTPSAPQSPTVSSINLSVKDVGEAAQKQSSAQTAKKPSATPAPNQPVKKKGLFGIFK